MMVLGWFLSAVSLTTFWLMGNKSIWGPIVGFFGQFLWFAFIFETKQVGLLPGVILYTFLHARNYFKWKKELSND